MNYGFYRVAAAIPSLKVADCKYNTQEIKKLVIQADKDKVSVVTFPELSITGYTCADLFSQSFLINKSNESIKELVEFSKDYNCIIVVGAPVRVTNNLYNTAVVIQKGLLLGIIPKINIPNYNEFYEQRWFSGALENESDTINFLGYNVPFGTDLLFQKDEFCFGVEICEDLWTPVPPSSIMAVNGANLLINLSASNELVGKNDYLKSLIEQQSARTISAYLYSSCGFGESTTDVVFAGNALIAENGVFLNENERFSLDSQLVISDIDIDKINNYRARTNTFNRRNTQTSINFRIIDIEINQIDDIRELKRSVNPYPFIPSQSQMHEKCNEIFNIQVLGLAQRIKHKSEERSEERRVGKACDSSLESG